MNMTKLALSAAMFSLVAACSSTPRPKVDYTALYQAAPHSVLIVPVVNHSNETQAADLFLTTLAIPLAERGYYVFPTNMTNQLMRSEGLDDPDLVHRTDTRKMARLFNADTVLYVEILDWSSKWAITSAKIKVKFLYTLKDGKTGALLWQNEQEYADSTSIKTGSFLTSMVANAIVAAANGGRSDYTATASRANAAALSSPGYALPYGPYSPEFKAKSKEFAPLGNGKVGNANQQAIAWPVEKP